MNLFDSNSSITNFNTPQYYIGSGLFMCISILSIFACCLCNNNPKYTKTIIYNDNDNEIVAYKISDSPPPYERSI